MIDPSWGLAGLANLKTVTGTEWDKPKKVKEEQQDGE